MNFAKQCNFDMQTLPDLYGQLSANIHGAPWSGPGVIAYLDVFPEPTKNFLVAMIEDLGLQVTQLSAPSAP